MKITRESSHIPPSRLLWQMKINFHVLQATRRLVAVKISFFLRKISSLFVTFLSPQSRECQTISFLHFSLQFIRFHNCSVWVSSSPLQLRADWLNCKLWTIFGKVVLVSIDQLEISWNKFGGQIGISIGILKSDVCYLVAMARARITELSA